MNKPLITMSKDALVSLLLNRNQTIKELQKQVDELQIEKDFWNGVAVKGGKRIAELQAQVVELKKLLKVAECPDGNCVNGAVGVWKGELPDGTEAWESYECQWCAERKAAIKGEGDE